MTEETDLFKDAYATYSDFADYSYKCITYLIENNETIWKLLKYNDPDAWKNAALTRAEKAALIYNSQPDASLYRVFMDSANPDVFTNEICQLRVYPLSIFPQTRSYGVVLMCFEIFAHFKINQLSNYQTRTDLGTKELISTLNGINITGIGRLHFNGSESREDKTITMGQLPFKGKAIYMSNKDI
jgi:hypothetical protein